MHHSNDSAFEKSYRSNEGTAATFINVSPEDGNTRPESDIIKMFSAGTLKMTPLTLEEAEDLKVLTARSLRLHENFFLAKKTYIDDLRSLSTSSPAKKLKVDDVEQQLAEYFCNAVLEVFVKKCIGEGSASDNYLLAEAAWHETVGDDKRKKVRGVLRVALLTLLDILHNAPTREAYVKKFRKFMGHPIIPTSKISGQVSVFMFFFY